MKGLKYIIALVGLMAMGMDTAQDTLETLDTLDKLDTPDTATTFSPKTKVYVFDIKENIAPAAWRNTQKAFDEAMSIDADYIIIHMNTYGGMVNIADSIRTKIINSPIPVFVFVDNNAASAGALISIACDSIYMRKGASIGAATVVDQSGQVVPDKYQSYMRSTMRATAESHGKDTVITGNDTIIDWHRNPRVAEAMVDPSIYVEGIVDTGKVLTFTASEAMAHGFCEGIAENIPEVLALAGIEDYTLARQEKTRLDRVINTLLSPILQGILLMIIIGGIYFELQTPGVGFPLGAALLAAILYFAPLYLEGMAENWELILFAVGLVLLGVEVFVIPGFGVAGISGIVMVVVGLTLAMIDNIVFTLDGTHAFGAISGAFATVLISFVASITLSVYLSRKVFMSNRGLFSSMALSFNEGKEDGYVSVDMKYKEMVGKTGIADTVLRPSGRVEIDNQLYDAISEFGFIERGEKVKVVRHHSGQLNVVKVKEG
jgi:membrane-bound serine protease (ClpP class)